MVVLRFFFSQKQLLKTFFKWYINIYHFFSNINGYLTDREIIAEIKKYKNYLAHKIVHEKMSQDSEY